MHGALLPYSGSVLVNPRGAGYFWGVQLKWRHLVDVTARYHDVSVEDYQTRRADRGFRCSLPPSAM